MRAYFFGNMYLSSIQQGIQAQHTDTALFVKYSLHGKRTTDVIGEKQRNTLYDWGKNHKTSILLNAGYTSTLRELIAQFDTPENPYPWCYFVEDEDAIGPLKPTESQNAGALTCVGIVLPEKIYDLSAELRGRDGAETEAYIRRHGEWLGNDIPNVSVPIDISKFELELALELTKYGLAS